MTRASTSVHVSDHSFGLFDHYEIPAESADYSSGLVVPMTSGAMIYTGIDRGSVEVSVELRDAPPDDLDGGGWEDIVEATVHAPHGQLSVQLLEFDAGPSPDLPVLSHRGAGAYRVRAHACGRDEHFDRVKQGSAESYLLVVWPAEPLPQLIIRATDQCGYGLRLSGLTVVKSALPAPAGGQQERASLRQAILDGMSRHQ